MSASEVDEPGTELTDTKQRQKASLDIDVTISEGPRASKNTPDEALIGTLFAERYRVLRLLGTGGMGAVYEAENEWTARRVALKILRPELSQSRDLVVRFVREARAATRIAHPNVVEILDMGQEPDGALYMVQELLSGNDLKTRLASEPPPTLQESLDIIVPIMGALTAAHSRAVIHRDVKPANILLAHDRSGATVPKLIDFGIAKVTGKSPEAGPLAYGIETVQGVLLGTPRYMSPEQVSGDPTIDARADVWSAGVVLYEMLAMKLPFDGSIPAALIHAILSADPARLDRIASVPEDVAGVIHLALARDRERRHASMRAFLDALLDCPSLADRDLALRHAESIPYARPVTPLSTRCLSMRCEDWEAVLSLSGYALAHGIVPIRSGHRPTPGTQIMLDVELPDGTKHQLRGVSNKPATGRGPESEIRVRLDKNNDALLLEQIALANIGPAFLAIQNLDPGGATAEGHAIPIVRGEPVAPSPGTVARKRSAQGAIAAAIGIDFGTTYTSASIAIGDHVYIVLDEHGRALHPSIVSYQERGLPIVGWEARPSLVADPPRTIASAKRLLGRTLADPMLHGYLASAPHRLFEGAKHEIMLDIDGSPVSPIEMAALIIEHVKRIAERQTGVRIDKAVLSVPISFDEAQRSALRRAGQRAGLEVLALVEEPIASAIAYSFGRDKRELIAVYDLGGGTFDFSVLMIEGNERKLLASGGDSWLGGDDFDLAIANDIAETFWRKSRVDLRRRLVEWQELLFACEQAKRSLSTEIEAEIVLERLIEYPKPMDLREVIGRARFEEISQAILNRTIQIAKDTLDHANLAARQLGQVVVTGGMSRAPSVQGALGELFGRPITMLVKPEEAVTLGAGIVAATLSGHRVEDAAMLPAQG